MMCLILRDKNYELFDDFKKLGIKAQKLGKRFQKFVEVPLKIKLYVVYYP